VVNPAEGHEAAKPTAAPPHAASGFLQPTPAALRNGRRTLAIFGAFVALALVLVALVPGFGDRQMVAVTAASCVALAGDAIAYLGRPTVTRYRTGLIVTTLAIVVGFAIAFANPFA
jgi:hypothetical protein